MSYESYDMSNLIKNRVEQAYEYLKVRLPKTITYRRLKTLDYDPELGITKTWWEEVTFNCILIKASERNRRVAGGLLQDGDLIAAINRSSFTKQSGELVDPIPKLGDEVILNGTTWGLDLGGKIFLELDPTEQVFFVGLRRAQ